MSEPIRATLARFYGGALAEDALLAALVAHGPWLVLADAGRVSAMVLAGKPNAFAWTDREALDTFLAKGGSRVVVGGKPLAQSVETWDRGFYLFHELSPQLACVQVNAMSGAPVGYSVEPARFPRVQRLAKDALIADVLAKGPADPRFSRVLKTHDAYRIVLLPDGGPMTTATDPGAPHAVVVFTSEVAWQTFLAKHPPPPGAQFQVLTMDGKLLFTQLRDVFRAQAVAFDVFSPTQLALDGTVIEFVLSRG